MSDILETDVEITIHDTDVKLTATGTYVPAEPDIGINSPWIEDLALKWPDGTDLPVELFDHIFKTAAYEVAVYALLAEHGSRIDEARAFSRSEDPKI